MANGKVSLFAIVYNCHPAAVSAGGWPAVSVGGWEHSSIGFQGLLTERRRSTVGVGNRTVTSCHLHGYQGALWDNPRLHVQSSSNHEQEKYNFTRVPAYI